MLVRGPLDKSFAFQRIQAIKRGFVGGDLAGKLNLPDEGRFPVFDKVALHKVEHDLLLLGEEEFRQDGLRRWGNLTIKL